MPRFTVPFGRLARLSRGMEFVATIGMVLIAALTVLGLANPDWTRDMLLAKFGQTGSQLPITASARLVAAAIIAIPVCIMLYGLWASRAMFREFAQGRVFCERAARHLQVFGACVLAQAPLGPLTTMALSLGMTFNQPPGERMLAIALSSTDYFALVVGGVLFAAATIMREAARLANENESFV
ncbi:MAG: DUF2975 domain-containing protein [Proteobacteria bacterium]|nr:DUF2975 domain-containing protein [Pseudomonadota bacterium]